MIRVLIADDEALVRGGFRMILEAQDDIEVVAEATDGTEAFELTRELSPDVVLMDVRMPGMNGLEATRRVVADTGGEGPRVLILTTFDLDEYVYEAMKAGASGFLLKSAPPGELAGAVRAVAGGDTLLAPEITKRLIEEFVGKSQPGERASLAGLLTDREREVLRMMARGLSNAEIAKALVVSEATVKTHVNRILGKLGLRDRVQAVVLAYESGFVTPGAPS
ncbi:MAG TPA: response regulator transcription factor [Actinomycetota bacterium]|nr:response regulator transcription factor [Actinomycetota bacterium]